MENDMIEEPDYLDGRWNDDDDHVAMDRDEPPTELCQCHCGQCNSGNHGKCAMQCDTGSSPDEEEACIDCGEVECICLTWFDGSKSPALDPYGKD